MHKKIEKTTKKKSKTMDKSIVQKKENNTGLPDNLKMGMERLSGLDLSDTRVHYNSSKPAQFQAHAYAQGSDIHIASGQEKHLPHELGHVVQQKQGRVKPTMQMKGMVNVNDDVGLEREADVLGVKALAMGRGAEAVQCPGMGGQDTRPDPIVARENNSNPKNGHVAQLYQPKENEVGQIFTVKTQQATFKGYVVYVGKKRKVSATIDENAEEYSWSFEDTDGNTFEVSNHREINDPNGKSVGVYNKESAKICQAPNCEKKFNDQQSLYRHVKMKHPFPKHDKYPYSLRGDQGAKSIIINRRSNGTFELVLGQTNSGKNLHSEWAEEKHLERSSKKKNAKYSTTNNIKELMTDKTKQGKSLFYTGLPHCVYCSKSLKSGNISLTYESEATPVQSQAYSIPKVAINQKSMLEAVGRNPENNKISKKNFKKFDTAQSYNKKLKKTYAAEKELDEGDLDQYLMYVTQALSLNSMKMDALAKAWQTQHDGKVITRDQFKQLLYDVKVPMSPYTFDYYQVSDDEDEGGFKQSDDFKDYSDNEALDTEVYINDILAMMENSFELEGVDGLEFTVSNWTQSDGNCGFYALMNILPDDLDIENRTKMADLVNEEHDPMPNIGDDGYWLSDDELMEITGRLGIENVAIVTLNVETGQWVTMQGDPATANHVIAGVPAEFGGSVNHWVNLRRANDGL